MPPHLDRAQRPDDALSVIPKISSTGQCPVCTAAKRTPATHARVLVATAKSEQFQTMLHGMDRANSCIRCLLAGQGAALHVVLPPSGLRTAGKP